MRLLLAGLLLAAAPVLAEEAAPPEPEELREDLIASVDVMMTELDGIIRELSIAVAERPDDEMLARLLADYEAQREALWLHRQELEAMKAGTE